jgi:hypothetical protein
METQRLDRSLRVVIFGSYSNGGSRNHVLSGGGGVEF